MEGIPVCVISFFFDEWSALPCYWDLLDRHVEAVFFGSCWCHLFSPSPIVQLNFVQ